MTSHPLPNRPTTPAQTPQAVKPFDLLSLDWREGTGREPADEALDEVVQPAGADVATICPAAQAPAPAALACDEDPSPGNRVHWLRVQRGWTLYHLAYESDVVTYDVHAIEVGKCPGGTDIEVADKLNRIAFALEADFNEVFPAPYLQHLRKIVNQRMGQCIEDGRAEWLPAGWGWYQEVSVESAPVAVESPEREVERRLLGEALHRVLADLPEIERQVLFYRFELDLTPRSTARLMHMTYLQVLAVEETALQRLRHPCHARHLRDWLRD